MLGTPALALRASQLIQLRSAVWCVRGSRRGVGLKSREHTRGYHARTVVRPRVNLDSVGVFSR